MRQTTLSRSTAETEITVTVKYEGFLKISVVLNKQSSVKDVSPGVSFVNMIFSLFH